MEAKCVKVEYEAGERITVQGVKGNRAGRYVDGLFFHNAGYGVGQHFIASELILYVRFSGEKLHRVLISQFFKDKLGRLTEQRREMVAQTMPQTVEVEKSIATIYAVSAKDLSKWFSRLQRLMESPAELRKIKQKIKEQKEETKKEKDLAEQELEQRWRQIDATEEARLNELRKNALKLSFIKGNNPKYGTEQWEARYDGRLYILRREDDYELEEKNVPVEKMFDLVPDRIVLVQRI